MKTLKMLEKKDIIGICAIAAVIAIVLVCLLPWPTRVNVTMDAAKLDADGNKLGTATLCIKGWKLNYLFREDRMDIAIEPFDNFKYFKLTGNQTGKTTVYGGIQSHTDPSYSYIHVYGWDSQLNAGFDASLVFSDDLSRWMLCDFRNGDGICYVASTNEKDQPADIWNFFHP